MSQPHTGVSLEVWQEFLAKHAEGGVVNGTVVSVVPFGTFVDVGDGIHGLLHKSESSETHEVGASIQIRINDVDLDRRRMSLLPA